MPRDKKQVPGEIRDGLVMYPGGTTWHYLVRWRGKIKRGDTKCEGRSTAATWLAKERKKWPLEEQGLLGAAARTLKDLWLEWDRLVGSHRSKTHRRQMKNSVWLHAAPWLDRPAHELTQVAFEELEHAYLTSTGEGFKRSKTAVGATVRKHSDGGWNRVAGSLRTLYLWALQRAWLAEVPFKVGLRDVSLTARGVLWPEQVTPFLATIDQTRKVRKGDPVPHAGILCRLMVGLGLRENEATNAEWDRLDWRRNVMIVARAITTGKAVKDKATREIPIPIWLRPYLLAWWAHCGRPNTGLVTVAKTGRAHGEGATKKMVLGAGDALGIVNLTPHGLRRTFATTLWEAGTELDKIAEMMGHENPMVTWNRYIIRRPKANAEAMERAAALMGMPSEPTLNAG